MTSPDSIKIVVASNNHYALLIAALIKSIELNHKTPEKIDLYIIDDGISSSSRDKIRASASPEMVTMHWFKTRDAVPTDIVIPNDKSAFPITTYLRLFAPQILPKGTKRYIYLDVDMIVLEDISKLWNSDLKGNIIAGVQDLCETAGSEWGGIPNYKELGIAPETLYFNAGMMVVDQEKWVEANITNRVIQAIQDNMKSVNFPDQYGLNVVLANKWQPLDKRWNNFAIVDVDQPFLIHYLDIKPFFKTYNGLPKYQEVFYKYLRLTPWKDHQPISGNIRTAKKVISKLKKIFISLTR